MRHDQALLFISGLDASGKLFSDKNVIRKPSVALSLENRNTLLTKLKSQSIHQLLRADEVAAVASRINTL